MKINNPTPHGFDQIFFPKAPPKEIAAPDKKPYLIFCMQHADANANYIKELDADFKNSALRVTSEGQYYWIITGHRKVKAAIDWFNKQSEYQNENEIVKASLDDLKEECDKAINNKKIEIPIKGKKWGKYEIINAPPDLKRKFTAGQNKGIELVKVESRNLDNQKFAIFKPNTRTLSEIEAFNSLCAEALLGAQHAKIRAVYAHDKSRLGTVSELIPSLELFGEVLLRYEKLNKKISIDQLIEWKVVNVWLTAYLEENDDLHFFNYGLTNDTAIAFDGDRATWSLTSRYKNVDPNQMRYKKDIPLSAPIDAFPITEEDIREFPFYKKARPYNSPDQDLSTALDAETLQQLKQDKRFQDAKHYFLLKRILIPNNYYNATGDATIVNAAKRKKFIENKINRTQLLEEVLIKMPEFKEYLKEYPDILDNIMKDFNNQNATIKDKDKILHIDLGEVQTKFKEINYRVNSTIKPLF